MANIQKAFKFRLYLNKKQIEYVNECFRTSNFIYNHFLADQKEISELLNNLSIIDKEDRHQCRINKQNEKLEEINGFGVGYYNAYNSSRKLTIMSKTPEFNFLNIPPTTMRGYVLSDLEKAFKSKGFPQFKDKNSKSFTVQIPQNKDKPKGFHLIIKKGKRGILKLPLSKYATINNIQGFEIVCHNPEFQQNWQNNKIIKLNTYTISEKNNQYFISIQAEMKLQKIPSKKPITEKTSIGVDFGVVRTVTTSREEDFEEFNSRIDALKNNLVELKRINQIISKKIDYYKKNKLDINVYKNVNVPKAYIRITEKRAKLFNKITNTRQYILHCISKKIVNFEDVDTIILEKLNIKNMSKKSAKGKSNNKKGLNRTLLDSGLYDLKTKIIYKAQKLGKNVVDVDPKYTSQECSSCGYIHKDNRETQAIFHCMSCGVELNADFNAALNIKNKFFKTKQ